MSRYIFISGAESGIGLASSIRLHAEGFHILAGVLPGQDPTSLDPIKGERLTLIPIDITRDDSISSAVQQIRLVIGDDGLYGLFNNAGIAISGPVEFVPLAAMRHQMEVNLFGHIAVTQRLLPHIRQTKGRIVNTASILGRMAVGFSSPYCMSKFAMEALTDSLRMEMRRFGVHVVAIEPGVIRTPIWRKSEELTNEIIDELPPEGQAIYGQALRTFLQTVQREGEGGTAPERVAAAVCHAFTASRPRTRYLVGTDARLVAVLKRWLPDRWFDRIINTRYPTG